MCKHAMSEMTKNLSRILLLISSMYMYLIIDKMNMYLTLNKIYKYLTIN
jgi:hypothetical protein